MTGSPRWNLLTCGRVRALPAADQFFAYAAAYLDSAERLCGVLARSPKRATFERGAVALYLSSHALELFLKGAILRKAPSEKFSHDLEHLHNRYTALYPGKRFAFTNQPFRTEYLGMSRAEIAAAKKVAPPINELYRYPADKGGNPWTAALGFEAGTYFQELVTLREDFNRLRSEYDR